VPDRIEEAFVQLGPEAPVTVFGCLDCGAAVAVAELHDARGQHLEWHDVQVRLMARQGEALDELTRIAQNHDETLKLIAGEGA
jgi:hypothetical protein